MKRLILSLALSLVLPVFAVANAGAVDLFKDSCNGSASSASVCQDVHAQGSSNTNPLISVIKVVIHILAFIIGLVSVIIIIISGLRMTTSGGSTETMSRARSGIIYAGVGLLVAAMAEAIVGFALKNIH